MDNLSGVNALSYFAYSDKDALAVLRVLGPAEFGKLNVILGVSEGRVITEAVDQGDVIVVQRDICQDYNAYKKIISTAHIQQKPVIFDLDDMLFMLPENHPDRVSGYFADALLPMLQAVVEADLVTVATEALKRQLLPFNPNIQVIPNYLNDVLWNFREIERKSGQDRTITIGYMGSKSHQPDLEMVLPALKILYDKYPDRLRFVFWGIAPPPELRKKTRVNWFPQRSYEYVDFVNFFNTQTADIVIAPLCDTTFNACKSSIKYLEYGVLGIPGVYSNIEPYSTIVKNGEDGFLATSIDDWVMMVSQLIDDPELGYRMAQNAQQNIRQSWLLSNHYQRQVEIYHQAILEKLEKRENCHPSAILDVFQYLSSQNYEELTRKKHKFEEYNTIIAEKNNQIDERNHKIEECYQIIDDRNETVLILNKQLLEAKEEMAGYLASKSWRYTRPFRNVAKRFRRSLDA